MNLPAAADPSAGTHTERGDTERPALLRLPASSEGHAPGPQHPLEEVPDECAVALSVNGVSQAVMMATPQSLDAFAYGFALTEGWIRHRHQVLDVELHRHAQGLVLEMRLSGECAQALQGRRRLLAGRSGCGLCGLESLEALGPGFATDPLMQLRGPTTADSAAKPRALPSAEALQRAATELAQNQPWHQRSGGLHAAALCTLQGQALWVHEDVGRHNALDKVLGSALLSGHKLDKGELFAIVSSRASYELVHKAVTAGLPALASVSAPTAQAIRSAQAAGLALWAFVREGRATRYA